MTEKYLLLIEKWDKIFSLDLSLTKKRKLYSLFENISLYNSENIKLLLTIAFKIFLKNPLLKISNKKKEEIYLFDIEYESIYTEDGSIISAYLEYIINRIQKEIISKNIQKIFSIETKRELNIISFYITG